MKFSYSYPPNTRREDTDGDTYNTKREKNVLQQSFCYLRTILVGATRPVGLGASSTVLLRCVRTHTRSTHDTKAPPRRCCVLHFPPKDAGASAGAFSTVRASHVATVDEDGLEEGLRRGK